MARALDGGREELALARGQAAQREDAGAWAQAATLVILDRPFGGGRGRVDGGRRGQVDACGWGRHAWGMWFCAHACMQPACMRMCMRPHAGACKAPAQHGRSKRMRGRAAAAAGGAGLRKQRGALTGRRGAGDRRGLMRRSKPRASPLLRRWGSAGGGRRGGGETVRLGPTRRWLCAWGGPGGARAAQAGKQLPGSVRCLWGCMLQNARTTPADAGPVVLHAPCCGRASSMCAHTHAHTHNTRTTRHCDAPSLWSPGPFQ